MKMSSLEFAFDMNEQSYIKSAKINAVNKRDIELQLINRKASLLPVTFSGTPAFISYNPDEYNMESEELVKEWIRDLRFDNEQKETLVHNITEHDAFVTMFSLNGLRKAGIPNFLYYHGVVNFGNNFFALTEQVFNKEYKNWPSFADICKTESFESIFEFYISVLLAIYNAYHSFEYTHYGLSCEDILMKPLENISFDVEYLFRKSKVYVNNKNYVPIITNQDKSYVRLNVDGIDKSFGYNNTDDIPFEFKGIYCDRGFPIRDAYSLLYSILEITKEYNPGVYNKFLEFSKFFIEGVDKEFMLYHDGTKDIHLGDFIAHLILNNIELVRFESKNVLLRCSGVQLEVKNNSADYYTYKNLIQLYDYYRIYNLDTIENIDNTILKKEVNKYEMLKNNLSEHIIIHQIPNIKTLTSNKKYIIILTENLVELIDYYNNWERLTSRISIITTLNGNKDSMKDLLEMYNSLYEEHKKYYSAVIKHFIKLKNLIREDKSIYDSLIKYVLFLESIE